METAPVSSELQIYEKQVHVFWYSLLIFSFGMDILILSSKLGVLFACNYCVLESEVMHIGGIHS